MEILSYVKIACIIFLTVNYKKINFYKIPIKIIKYLKNNKKKEKNNKIEELIFIKDGEEKVIYNLLNNSIIENKLNENIFKIGNLDVDFLIYNNNNNIIRLKNISEFFNVRENGFTIKRKLFLSLKLIYFKKNQDIPNELTIDLKQFNYFIEDNILLDYLFIKWYSKKYFNLEIDKNDDYHFILLDNSIKEYKLNKLNKIIITKDYFTIEDENYYMVSELN